MIVAIVYIIGNGQVSKHLATIFDLIQSLISVNHKGKKVDWSCLTLTRLCAQFIITG